MVQKWKKKLIQDLVIAEYHAAELQKALDDPESDEVKESSVQLIVLQINSLLTYISAMRLRAALTISEEEIKEIEEEANTKEVDE